MEKERVINSITPFNSSSDFWRAGEASSVLPIYPNLQDNLKGGFVYKYMS